MNIDDQGRPKQFRRKLKLAWDQMDLSPHRKFRFSMPVFTVLRIFLSGQAYNLVVKEGFLFVYFASHIIRLLQQQETCSMICTS